MKLKLLLLALLLTSCQKEYNTEICDELAQQTFKGYPNQSREFADNCQGIKINYPPQRCQEALQGLMLGKSIKELQEVFGPKVEGCFTKSDLEKFAP